MFGGLLTSYGLFVSAKETTKRLMARVKQIRLARGLTQEQFAERADLDPKFYQHAEAGRKPNPGMETLLRLAQGCGLKLSELLDFEREAQPAADNQAEDVVKVAPRTRKAKTSNVEAGQKTLKSKRA